MSDETDVVQYGALQISYRIRRRDRRTLEIAVEPDMSVTATAPLDAPLEKIRAKLKKRAAWILRQQRYFLQFVPRRTPRRYLPGETHLYLGRQYRLKVERAIQAGVKLKRGFLHVYSHFPDNADVTKELVQAWYRQRAHIKLPERIELCREYFPRPQEVQPSGLIIRTLRQRWGSMSPTGRLVLNDRLLEAPTPAIDYVITHELCHILEAHHGPRFFELLSRVLPDWESRKSLLERTCT